MQFERFTDFPSVYHEPKRYDAYVSRVEEHWRSLGWEKVPAGDEPMIKAAWLSLVQPRGKGMIIPKPSRAWRGKRLAQHQQQPELEAEFTLKLLAAFRRCTRPGERLWVIDWQHSWYYFNPQGDITVATRDEWAKPVLPDGDSYNYVAPDFRFGVITGWRETGPVTLFGANLLAAFDADPPKRFMRVCGTGKHRRGEPTA